MTPRNDVPSTTSTQAEDRATVESLRDEIDQLRNDLRHGMAHARRLEQQLAEQRIPARDEVEAVPAALAADSASCCPFCRIIAGHAPADIIRQWPDALAIRPRSGGVHEGHVLVIPKRHVADAGTDPAVSAATMARAAELMAELGAANIITSKGSDATQTVFHLHIHVVRRQAEDGLALPWTGQAERNAAQARLDVLRDRVEDAGSMMVTDYVREALDGGTARSVAEYVRGQAEEVGQ